MTQTNLTYEQYLPTKVLFGAGQLNNWCITKPYNKGVFHCWGNSIEGMPFNKSVCNESIQSGTQHPG